MSYRRSAISWYAIWITSDFIAIADKTWGMRVGTVSGPSTRRLAYPFGRCQRLFSVCFEAEFVDLLPIIAG